MSEAGRQAALSTMSGARAAVARLDASRDPEDVAAELVEVWAAIETALRGLVGGSPLRGQDLVREVRRREGRYLLRTNLTASDPAELWRTYIQLTQVEEAFRNLKGDLAIRPIYHQHEDRILSLIHISEPTRPY